MSECSDCQRRIEPPVCECGHDWFRHYDGYLHCGYFADNAAHLCDCEGYDPQPTLCADCERAAKDEAVYDEHFGISVDDRRR